MERKVIVKRVHLESLLRLITDLFDKGVDYVDLHGEQVSEDVDSLTVSFTREYMNSDFIEAFDELNSKEETKIDDEVKKSLSDDDINQLL